MRRHIKLNFLSNVLMTFPIKFSHLILFSYDIENSKYTLSLYLHTDFYALLTLCTCKVCVVLLVHHKFMTAYIGSFSMLITHTQNNPLQAELY